MYVKLKKNRREVFYHLSKSNLLLFKKKKKIEPKKGEHLYALLERVKGTNTFPFYNFLKSK